MTPYSKKTINTGYKGQIHSKLPKIKAEFLISKTSSIKKGHEIAKFDHFQLP